MRTMFRVAVAGAVLFACFYSLTRAGQNRQTIDGKKSSITVHVYKTGFLSSFAHNHKIEAPIDSGQMTDAGDQASVEVYVDARKLHVVDPEASADTRAQIQKTMLSSKVLGADRYPDIRFRSTTIEAKARDRWLVNGTFELHGQKHPLETEVTLRDGLYEGSWTLKQTEFSITPVTVAGGTVKVKDEVRIEFRIAPSVPTP